MIKRQLTAHIEAESGALKAVMDQHYKRLASGMHAVPRERGICEEGGVRARARLLVEGLTHPTVKFSRPPPRLLSLLPR